MLAQLLVNLKMLWKRLMFTVLIALLTSRTQSANILGIFPVPGHSHVFLGNILMNELAARGHQVTFITAFPQKEIVTNLTQIPLTEMNILLEDLKAMDFWAMEKDNPIISVFTMTTNFGYHIANKTFGDPAVQKLLKSNAKFDLVILETFNNEAHFAFAHHFQAPIVLVAAPGPSFWTNHIVRNPASPAYVPDLFLDYSPRMTFTQRIFNTVFGWFQDIFYNIVTYRIQNNLLHKYFPDAPELQQLLYNTSLILLNSHLSIKSPMPLVPNMIEVGGYHVQPPKKLPHNLQGFLDNAEDGVIYFSMGSNLRSSTMPVEKREAILKVLSKLKQKVLWKWEEEHLPGQPANVKTQKWLPQTDILAHPNVKLFISHGGMLSTTESVYHGVPIVGIPIYGDQKMNIANAELNGYAISVPFSELDENNLERAIREVLENPKYAETAKLRSQIMHDQPLKPLEKAMYWIEYVIRHKGAYHLRTSALDLTWCQYTMLDIALVFIVGILILDIWLYKLITTVCCRKKEVNAGKNSSKKNKKKFH